MSSESLSRENMELFLWQDGINTADYVEATYYLETAVDPELAAVAMAKEQSVTTAKPPSLSRDYDLGPSAARVTSVECLGETSDSMLPSYQLSNPSYQAGDLRQEGYWRARVRIAFPIANFSGSLTNLWSAVGGELHRLGFLNALKIEDLNLPQSFLEQFSGPMHGVSGIKSDLGIKDRPIFCRATRPAVGLTTEMMLAINEQILRGGFDMVKDDELTCDTSLSPFRERIRKMVDLTRRLEDETGEKKYYVANVIDDTSKSFEHADLAAKAGANALILAPAIQGFAIAGEIARRTSLAVLCHNSWADVATRHPRFGFAPALFFKMQRICGADMILLPGDFATQVMSVEEERACVAACLGPLGPIKPSLPIIAGGKTPEGLPIYIRAVGTTDFIVISSTAVDIHPDGLEAGAHAFREACAQLDLTDVH